MALDSLPRMPAESMRERLVRALREAIVTGELKPGDRLVERDVSARTGMSRGPVREAFHQLEQEGLVTSAPYRGTEVVGVSREEVEEVLVPVRLTLEKAAFRHALPRLTDEDLVELERLVASMRRAAKEEDLRQLVESDVRFHEVVFEQADQPHCAQIWRTIAPRVRAYFYRDITRHTTLGEIAEGHQELLDAVRTRDMEKVLPVLHEHIVETFHLADEGDARKRAGASLEAAEKIGGGEDER